MPATEPYFQTDAIFAQLHALNEAGKQAGKSEDEIIADIDAYLSGQGTDRESVAKLVAGRIPVWSTDGSKIIGSVDEANVNNPGYMKYRSPDGVKVRVAGLMATDLGLRTGVKPALPQSRQTRGLASYGVEDQSSNIDRALGITDPEGQYEVRKDPMSGREIVSQDGGQTWTYFNSPGLDTGDLRALEGHAGQIGGSVAGITLGVTSSGASAGQGAVVLGGLGSFVGAMQDLKRGSQKNMHNLSESEMIAEAAKRAGVDLALLIGTVGAGKLYSIFKSGQAGGTIAKGITAEQFEADLQAAAKLQKQIQTASGEEFPIDAGNVIGMSSPNSRGVPTHPMRPDLQVAEEAYARDFGYASQLRANEVQRGEALKALEDKTFGQFGQGTANADDVARGIQGTARTEAEARIAAEEAKVLAAERGVSSALDDATQAGVDPYVAGKGLRATAEQGRKAVRDQFKVKYNEIDELSEGLTVDLAPLRKTGRLWKDKLEQDILPSLAEEDAKLVRDLLGAGIKRETAPSPLEGLRSASPQAQKPQTTVTEKPATIGSVSRALSALKRERRLMGKGIAPPKEIKLVDDAIDTLTNIRNKALEGRPELAAQVKKVDDQYAVFQEKVNRDKIGELLNKKEGGGYRIKDEGVTDKILRDPDGTLGILDVVDLYPAEFAGVKTEIRKGIIGAYDAYVRVDGKLNAARHRAFMNNRRYKRVIEAYFSPEEQAKFSNVGKASDILIEEQRRAKQAIAAIERESGVRIASWEPDVVVDRLFSTNNISLLNTVKVQLGPNSQAWKDFQHVAAQRLKSDITGFTPAGYEAGVNMPKMAKWLEPGSANEKLLMSTFGQGYVSDLRFLLKANQFAAREAIQETSGKYLKRQIDTPPQGLVALVRGLWAPPLSKRGRLFTGAIGERARRIDRMMDAALADPTKLKKLVALRTTTPAQAWRRGMLSEFGVVSYDDYELLFGTAMLIAGRTPRENADAIGRGDVERFENAN